MSYERLARRFIHQSWVLLKKIQLLLLPLQQLSKISTFAFCFQEFCNSAFFTLKYLTYLPYNSNNQQFNSNNWQLNSKQLISSIQQLFLSLFANSLLGRTPTSRSNLDDYFIIQPAFSVTCAWLASPWCRGAVWSRWGRWGCGPRTPGTSWGRTASCCSSHASACGSSSGRSRPWRPANACPPCTDRLGCQQSRLSSR